MGILCHSGIRAGICLGTIQWLVRSVSYGYQARGTSSLFLFVFRFCGWSCTDNDAPFRSALGWIALSLLPDWPVGRAFLQPSNNGSLGYN